ncbi:MAG: MFS family permease [Halioglobus sp.]|jgi:MFS family permease
MGWSPAIIGITGSAYFLGFILGCFFIPLLIRRVGHVRVFTVCSGLAIIAILTVQKWHVVPVWIMARAVTGVAFAGLYMVLESWLNESSPSESRGAVLSFYGFLSLVAMSLGQLLVLDANIDEGAIVVAIIFGLAILPVALTTSPQPEIPSEVTLSFAQAYRASQVGPILAGVSGFVMGLIWSNGAVYASSVESDAGANFIAATLMGGVVCQLPVGRLSDWIDRRWVLLGLCLIACGGIAVCLALPTSKVSLYTLGFVLGGTAMPMYSLAIAHANDNADGKFLIISSAMLVANGVGSTVGPLLYGGFNALGFSDVYFVIIGVAYFFGATWTAYRIVFHDSVRTYYEPFQVLPKTTLGAADLDPRSEDEHI